MLSELPCCACATNSICLGHEKLKVVLLSHCDPSHMRGTVKTVAWVSIYHSNHTGDFDLPYDVSNYTSTNMDLMHVFSIYRMSRFQFTAMHWNLNLLAWVFNLPVADCAFNLPVVTFQFTDMSFQFTGIRLWLQFTEIIFTSGRLWFQFTTPNGNSLREGFQFTVKFVISIYHSRLRFQFTIIFTMWN